MLKSVSSSKTHSEPSKIDYLLESHTTMALNRMHWAELQKRCLYFTSKQTFVIRFKRVRYVPDLSKQLISMSDQEWSHTTFGGIMWRVIKRVAINITNASNSTPKPLSAMRIENHLRFFEILSRKCKRRKASFTTLNFIIYFFYNGGYFFLMN